MKPPVIYNLFPRLAGPMDRWLPHAQRASSLGFNWIFLNPVQKIGGSGNLYAIEDHLRVDRSFLPAGVDEAEGMAALSRVLDAFHALGLRVMAELVVNYTAADSPLVDAHPSWFRWSDEEGEPSHPMVTDPRNPGVRVEAKDLAEIDLEASTDREGLLDYWDRVVQEYLRLGFDGFRCAAAHKVSAGFWRRLITRAKARHPEARFFAAPLGCTAYEVFSLKDCGFDYLFNSSKWWEFDQPWAVEQHETFQEIAPSISFPESHDTRRVADWSEGLVQVQMQRYAFAAAFSAGVMMPIGYEYGFTRPLDPVTTTPGDWEEPTMDITDFLGRVNGLKLAHPIMGEEGHVHPLGPYDQSVLGLEKTSNDDHGAMAIIINKDWRNRQRIHLAWEVWANRKLHRVFSGEVAEVPDSGPLNLDPAEVVLLL